MNVILIMEDSFRYDHLGCNGNKWIKTPNIDRFASQGIVFDHAYAEGLPTIPVRIALQTGRYTLPFRGWQPLEQADIPFSEVLWGKGYTSALISDTYHMHKPQMGFSRGFDYVEWIKGQESDPFIIDPSVKVDVGKYSEKNWYPSYPGYSRPKLKQMFEQCLKNTAHWKSEDDQLIAQVVKAGIAWLEKQVSNGRKDRLILYLDSFDPHEPWDPPTPYKEMYTVPEYTGLPNTWGGGFINEWSLAEIRHIRAQYAGKITMVDKWTGILLQKVEDLGLLENTLIIFLSDHGEPLGEHGIVKKVQPWPYDELSHIPFIIKLPEGMEKGKRISSFMAIPDVAPTILDFLGVKIPSSIQGKSQLSVIRNEVEGDKFGISGYYNRSRSIRNREWSYYQWTGELSKKKPELYKFNPKFMPPEPKRYELEDQSEKDDKYEVEVDVAKSLADNLETFINQMKPSTGDLNTQSHAYVRL